MRRAGAGRDFALSSALEVVKYERGPLDIFVFRPTVPVKGVSALRGYERSPFRAAAVTFGMTTVGECGSEPLWRSAPSLMPRAKYA